jgi:3',5'-cyclic-AMP phosphodiesterase
MTNGANGEHLTWAHVGDLHITGENESNYRDFLSIVETINTHLAGHIDFCVLPGDNADDGSSDQYALIRGGLERLKVPIHVIPGDHDRKPGDLRAFYQGLRVALVPNATTVGGYRCLFLDVVSHGNGGPDFALGRDQLQWLESELKSANSLRQASVVFMHAYPADLKVDGDAVRQLLKKYRVILVDMGHTHYNELSNDGTTIFATTRSTGQIEEGPVGFSFVSLNRGVVSWRFKPLRSLWPFVMITSPADYRLVTDVKRPEHVVAGEFTVMARVWGAGAVSACRCRIDESPWNNMHRSVRSSGWELVCQAPPQQFTLTVEATDASGGTGTDSIVVATPGYRPPDRAADGSDADALGPWPERHLLGTRLGPNRNGRQW